MEYLKICLIGLIIIFLGCTKQQEVQELGQAKTFKLYDTDSVTFALENYMNITTFLKTLRSVLSEKHLKYHSVKWRKQSLIEKYVEKNVESYKSSIARSK